MGQTLYHEKIVIEASPMGIRDYADVYRFGGVTPGAPLLHYTGGTITAETHAGRFGSEPTPIVEQLTGVVGPARLDVIVSPSPPAGPVRVEDRLEAWLEYVVDVLIPKAGLTPADHAFVGYSFGAHLATYLAATCQTARALVSIGGVGVVEAARAAGSVAAPRLEARLFRNVDDGVPDPINYAGTLPQDLGARAAPHRLGGHPFVDYAVNGTVSDAFAFALERLTAR